MAVVPFVTSIPLPSTTEVTVPADEAVMIAAKVAIVAFLVVPLSSNAIESPLAGVAPVKVPISIPNVSAP